MQFLENCNTIFALSNISFNSLCDSRVSSNNLSSFCITFLLWPFQFLCFCVSYELVLVHYQKGWRLQVSIADQDFFLFFHMYVYYLKCDQNW